MASTYNFLKSLENIDSRIKDEMNSNSLPAIPLFGECGDVGTHFVYGTVVSVRFGIRENVSNLTDIAATKLLECFVAESCEILRSNQSCRDVIVMDSMITAVYSTSLKTEINELLDDMARIRSMASVVCKKAGFANNQITVRLAACYDCLTMSIVESRPTYKQYLWRGTAISKALDLSEKVDEGCILISKVVWNNLTDANQKLFKLNSFFEEVYEGSIVNIAMNNWLDTK